MIDPRVFLGYPIELRGVGLIYPPKIKEVLNTEDFHKYLEMFIITQDELEEAFIKNNKKIEKRISPFDYLLTCAYYNKEFKETMNAGFMFFMHETVTVLFEQRKLLIGDITAAETVDQLRILDEKNYPIFQNIIRLVVGLDTVEIEEENENIPEKLREMRAKSRLRDKIKAKQQKDKLDYTTILAAICCIDNGLNPLNIGELSYAATDVLLHMYQQKEQFDIDIKMISAGADSKKIKPKYWLKNFD